MCDKEAHPSLTSRKPCNEALDLVFEQAAELVLFAYLQEQCQESAECFWTDIKMELQNVSTSLISVLN